MTYCVLEGCDGTGKSTLAEAISLRYNVLVQHDGPPDDPDYALAELIRDLEGSPTDCVWDRWHFGNMVYGSIFRGKPDLTAWELELFEEILGARGALLVLCKPPLEVVRDNIQSRAAAGKLDERGFEDSWERSVLILDGMNVMYSVTHLPKVLYDYTDPLSLRIVYKAIEKELGWVVS